VLRVRSQLSMVLWLQARKRASRSFVLSYGAGGYATDATVRSLLMRCASDVPLLLITQSGSQSAIQVVTALLLHLLQVDCPPLPCVLAP
jgi:hypothetical protein